jgi:hypothetical protein
MSVKEKHPGQLKPAQDASRSPKLMRFRRLPGDRRQDAHLLLPRMRRRPELSVNSSNRKLLPRDGTPERAKLEETDPEAQYLRDFRWTRPEYMGAISPA